MSITPDETAAWDDSTIDPPRAGGRFGVSSWGMSGLAILTVITACLAWVIRDVMRGGEPQAPRGHFRQFDSSLGAVAVAPDGKSLVLGQMNGLLELQVMPQGEELAIEEGELTTMRAAVFSPDGTTLASAGVGNVIKLWNMPAGNLWTELFGHETCVRSLAFSPDSKILASGGTDGSIRLWDLTTGDELLELKGHDKDVWSLAFAPDGKSLASGSHDGSVRIWDVETGREKVAVRDPSRRVYGLAYTPDGKTLAFGLGASQNGQQGKVVLWEVEKGREAVRVIDNASTLAVALSPNGKTLATAGLDRVVKLWDLATGKELACMDGHRGFIASLTFSPDGRYVISGGYDSLVGQFPVDQSSLKNGSKRL